MRSLFLTTLHTVVVAGVVGIPCTQEQHTRMQEQFSDCRSNFTHQIHNDRKEGKEELLCSVLDGIVNICSKNWKQCHSQQEINSMKDMHIDAFLKHWGEDTSLDLCSIVKRFRLSQRIAESEEAAASCSDEDSRSSMSNFQSCSHTISSTVYSSILELEEEKGVVSELCSGLDKIALQCPVHLEHCFGVDDITKMKGLHLEEMTRFFSRLVEDRVKKTWVNSCTNIQTQNQDKASTMIPATTGDLEQHREQENLQVLLDTVTPDPTWTMQPDIPSYVYEDKDKNMDEDALYGDDWNVVVSTDGLDTIQRILRTEETTAADDTSMIAGESSLKSNPEQESISGSALVLPRTISFLSVLLLPLLI